MEYIINLHQAEKYIDATKEKLRIFRGGIQLHLNDSGAEMIKEIEESLILLSRSMFHLRQELESNKTQFEKMIYNITRRT